MSIPAIGNVSGQAAVSQTSSVWANTRQDLKGLEDALLKGDVSGAQSALASLQQTTSGAPASTNPNSVLSQLGQSDSSLGQDLKAVSNALSINDIGSAQKAFAKLREDMQSAFQANGAAHAHHGHHAHHAKRDDGDANSTSATQSSSAPALNSLLQSMSGSQSSGSSANDLLNALQSLASANPKVAGDLVTLITDLNHVGTVVNTAA